MIGVVRVDSVGDQEGLAVDIRVMRVQHYLGPAPSPHDVPEDVRAGLRAWLDTADREP